MVILQLCNFIVYSYVYNYVEVKQNYIFQSLKVK